MIRLKIHPLLEMYGCPVFLEIDGRDRARFHFVDGTGNYHHMHPFSLFSIDAYGLRFDTCVGHSIGNINIDINEISGGILTLDEVDNI